VKKGDGGSEERAVCCLDLVMDEAMAAEEVSGVDAGDSRICGCSSSSSSRRGEALMVFDI
jgi:hypothetical protein